MFSPLSTGAQDVLSEVADLTSAPATSEKGEKGGEGLGSVFSWSTIHPLLLTLYLHLLQNCCGVNVIVFKVRTAPLKCTELELPVTVPPPCRQCQCSSQWAAPWTLGSVLQWWGESSYWLLLAPYYWWTGRQTRVYQAKKSVVKPKPKPSLNSDFSDIEPSPAKKSHTFLAQAELSL